MIRTQVILTMLTTLSLMSFDLIGVNAQSNSALMERNLITSSTQGVEKGNVSAGTRNKKNVRVPRQTPVMSQKLETDCRVFGGAAEKYEDLIPVANKLEETSARFSFMYGNSRSLLCKIVKNSGELNLVYALPDNSPLNRVRLKVYLDGNLSNTFNLSRGEVLRQKIDLRGASGYKLDFEVVSVSTQSFFSLSQCYVYALNK